MMNFDSDCDRCLLNARSPYLVCAIHPKGVSNKCPDFRPDPKLAEEELWSPEGYYWYDGDLIPHYPSRLTNEEKLEILDTHPFFTGICPNYCITDSDRDERLTFLTTSRTFSMPLRII
jgi:hypothetical protein